MPKQNPPKMGFDLPVFVENLIAKMGMSHEPDAQRKEMEERIYKEITYRMLDALSLNVEPYILDEVAMGSSEEKDPFKIVTELMRRSSQGQIAAMEALDRFEKEILTVCRNIKK